MYGGLNDSRQGMDAFNIDVTQIQTEKIDESLVEEVRHAVGRQPPEVAGHHVHELREFPLPRAQCLLGLHLVIDVDRDCKPFHYGAVVIPRWFPSTVNPAIDAI